MLGKNEHMIENLVVSLSDTMYNQKILMDTDVKTPKEATPLISSFLNEQKKESGELPYTIPLPAVREIVHMPTLFRHQKDVSIISIDGTYYMMTSVSEVDDQSNWDMRSYSAPSPIGPWRDLGKVTVEGEKTPRMCAAGILEKIMTVQTECFAENGTIEVAQTEDMVNYHQRRTILHSQPGTELAGIYDPEPTEIILPDGSKRNYITFTGVKEYNAGKAKNGAIYLAEANAGWTKAQIIKKLFTEQPNDPTDALYIPPHVPTTQNGEWVPEGGKAYQLILPDTNEEKIIFYGTTFIEGNTGNRQRGFLAVADEITGTYTFLGLLHPRNNLAGETGHGTVEVERSLNGDPALGRLHILHQARDQDPEKESSWRIERTTYNLKEFLEFARRKQHSTDSQR